MSYASRREVVFRKPFNVSRTGFELPAGSYVVNTEVRFLSERGQTSRHNTNFLEIPHGALGSDHLGGTLLVTDAELDEAQLLEA